MSRGLGKLQRRLLAELEHGASSVLALCERIFGSVTAAQYSAARRAIRSLIRRGLVVERLPRARVYRIGRAPTTQNVYVLRTSTLATNATLNEHIEVTNARQDAKSL